MQQRRLELKRILAVSAVYDLALIETEENVTNYLRLREDPVDPGENLFLNAYPDGTFKEMKKTRDIIYEDDQRYDFPVNHSDLGGVSGSPILDEQGQVIGVAFGGFSNLLSTIKINYLQKFIKGDIGTNCVKSISVIVRFFNKECIKKEMERLQKLAEEGSVYAQYMLAYTYEERFRESDVDIHKAIKWYELAAEQGYAPAQYNLGGIYGVSQRFKKALQWYEKAIEQKYIPAQVPAALMYLKGDVVEKDAERAFRLLIKGAEKSYAEAQFLLGERFHTGQGVEPDINEAIKWYKLSAKQGNIHAQIILGELYFRGEEIDQNFTEAIKWYGIAAEQRDPSIQPLVQEIHFLLQMIESLE